MYENELMSPPEPPMDNMPEETVPDKSADLIKLEANDTIETFREKVIDQFILEARQTIDTFEEEMLRKYEHIVERLEAKPNVQQKAKIISDFHAIPDIDLVNETVNSLWDQFKRDYRNLHDFGEIDLSDRENIRDVITNRQHFPTEIIRKRIRTKLYNLSMYIKASINRLQEKRASIVL